MKRVESPRGLGPLEGEVMQVVWTSPDAPSVREVVERLNRERSPALAYTTVMTVMNRLAGKGILARRKEGRGYRYEATVADRAAIAVQGVMRDFGEAAVAHFVEQARDDPALRRRLERLLVEEA